MGSTGSRRNRLWRIRLRRHPFSPPAQTGKASHRRPGEVCGLCPSLLLASRALTRGLLRLDQKAMLSESPTFLSAIDGILKSRPQALEPVLARSYKVLGNCCHDAGSPREFVDLIRGAVVTPLVAAHVTSTPIYFLPHSQGNGSANRGLLTVNRGIQADCLSPVCLRLPLPERLAPFREQHRCLCACT